MVQVPPAPNSKRGAGPPECKSRQGQAVLGRTATQIVTAEPWGAMLPPRGSWPVTVPMLLQVGSTTEAMLTPKAAARITAAAMAEVPPTTLGTLFKTGGGMRTFMLWARTTVIHAGAGLPRRLAAELAPLGGPSGRLRKSFGARPDHQPSASSSTS